MCDGVAPSYAAVVTGFGGVQGFAETELLRIAVEVGRLGMWRWDPVTGVVTWDSQMEARYGLAPGEFSGTFEDFVDRVHPDDREAVVARIAAARDVGEDLSFEHRIVWPDGSVHWLDARGRVQRDETGAMMGMVGVGIDIDERKRLETIALEEVELRAAAAMAHGLEEAERIAALGSWPGKRRRTPLVSPRRWRGSLDARAR